MSEDLQLDPNQVLPPEEHLDGVALDNMIDEQDPLAGDVDRVVDPLETRSDAEIERDERREAQAHMAGTDNSDEYWAEYDELHRERPKPPRAEDIYEFSEKDLADREDARGWLRDALSYYKEQAKPFMATDREGDEHIQGPTYSEDWKQHGKAYELQRLAEGKYHHSGQTSNSSPLQALETINTGIFRARNGGAVGDKDASEDLRNTTTEARDIHDFHNGGPKPPKQLTIDELRMFTSKFAELQRQREETITVDGFDPLKNQAEDVFKTNEIPSDRIGEEEAWDMAHTAESAERTTERTEYWEGVLRHQPISNAYKKRFGLDEEVTPETLIKLEDELATDVTERPTLSDKLKRTFIEDIRTGRASMWQ